MSENKDDVMPNKVITPKAILSYPHLFVPSTMDDKKPRYSCALIFPEGSDMDALKAAVVHCGKQKWGDKFEDMVKAGSLRLPFRTDGEAKGYPSPLFMNVRTEQKPGMVMPYAGEDGRPMPLTDETLMYPGAVVRASLYAFSYDRSGNKGVSFALGNLQWVEHGERLDNRKAASDEFEPLEETPGDSNLADLL